MSCLLDVYLNTQKGPREFFQKFHFQNHCVPIKKMRYVTASSEKFSLNLSTVEGCDVEGTVQRAIQPWIRSAAHINNLVNATTCDDPTGKIKLRQLRTSLLHRMDCLQRPWEDLLQMAVNNSADLAFYQSWTESRNLCSQSECFSHELWIGRIGEQIRQVERAITEAKLMIIDKMVLTELETWHSSDLMDPTKFCHRKIIWLPPIFFFISVVRFSVAFSAVK